MTLCRAQSSCPFGDIMRPGNKKVREAKIRERVLSSGLGLCLSSSIAPTWADPTTDLSSRTRDNVAAIAGTIKVGTGVKAIAPGDLLTDAEQLALNQVSAGGAQTLLLNALGTARGGTFRIDNIANNMEGLVVPRGVTALQNIAQSSLNISGTLSNSGRIFFYSNDAHSVTANVAAQNIFNNTGGLLSTMVPASLLNGLIINPHLSLNLSAVHNIMNAGVIRSAGNLTLTAGDSIINTGVLQASNNLNVISNTLTNSNLITAATGNINISSLNSGSISINNVNGTLQALLINIRDTLFNAKSDFSLTGGNILCDTLNVNSGDGLAGINVHDLTGVVNVHAGEVHIATKTASLNLGELNISGDPSFYNQFGNIDFTSPFNFSGESLAIIAKGDITANGDNLTINTSSSTTNGGAITLVAGANFTLIDPATSSAYPGKADAATTLKITGGSTTGGKIDLNVTNNKDVTQLSSASTFAGASGGDIKLIAFKGSATNSGSINLPNSLSIDTSGAAAGKNGNILIIANGSSSNSNAITIGGINANGAGSLPSGNAEVHAATPLVGTGVSIVDGAITSGAFLPGTYSKNGIQINANSDVGGSFTTKTGGTALFSDIKASGDVMLTAGSTPSKVASEFGLIVNDISSTGNVTLNTTGTASGIGFLGAVHNGTVTGNNVSFNSNAGNITLNYAVNSGGTMVASTSGTGAIKLTNKSASDSFIGTSNAPSGKFEIDSLNSITTTGPLSSPQVSIKTSSATANISLGANIGKAGASVQLTVSGNGNISQSAGKIIGKSIILNAASGDIGSLASPVSTSTSQLSVTTNGALVNINNSGTLAVDASGSGDLFKLFNTGDITIAKGGGIISPRVELETPKNIVLAAQVGSLSSAGNNIKIAAASISQTAGVFRILGGDVFLSLNSSTGNIGSAALPIRTTAQGLGMISPVSAFATNSGNLKVLNSLAFSGTYKLVNDGDVTVAQLLQSGPVIDIQTQNDGNIIVSSRLGGTSSGQVNLNAAGTGTITTIDPPGPIPGVIEGLNVTLKTGTGDLGSKSSPLQTSAINLALNTAGDAYIGWAPNANSVSTLFGYALTVKASSVKDVSINANGPLIIAGAITAQNVSINTFNDATVLPDIPRDITIKANIGTSGTGSSSLTASNTGNKTSFGSADIVRVTGTILSSTAILLSEDENIGSAKIPISTSSQTLSASTSGNGSVFISNAGNIVLLNSGSPGGTFSLQTTGTVSDPGDISLSTPITAVKDLLLQTKGNNASINLNGNSINADNITLTAFGAGKITDLSGTATLSASKTINLLSTNGNIGSNTSRLQIGSGTVLAKTAAAVFLNLKNSATISDSAAGTQFDLTSDASADISIAGSISSPNIQISANGNIVASTNSKHTLAATIALSLMSQNGNIGSGASPVLTKAKAITVVSTNGSAYIRNTGKLTLNTSSSDNASNDSWLSIQNVGSTNIAGKLSSDSVVNISSTSTLTQSNNSVAITAPTVSLSSAVSPALISAANFGTAQARIQVDASNLTIDTKGIVFINNVGSTGNLNTNAFSGNGFDITSGAGNITVNGAITSPVVSITASGNVIIAANTGKIGGKTNISATNISRVSSATVIGATVLLSTGSGDIGAIGSNNDLLLDASNLIIKQNGGSAFIVDILPGTINVSPDKTSISAEFVLTNNGNIVVKAPLQATVALTLNSGSGALSTSGNGLLQASILNLGGAGQTGNLGSELAAIKISANVVSAKTDKGSVNLLNSGSSALSVNGSQSGQSFKIANNTGQLSIDGAITVGQAGDLAKRTNNLTLLETGSNGAISLNADLNVTGGSVLINALDLGGKIVFADGVSTNTMVDLKSPITNGVIKIAIGKPPTAPSNPLSSNGNFTVNNTAPGVVFGGVNPNALLATGAKVQAITLNAKGRNIIFNSASSGSIQFGDNVTVTADPPGANALINNDRTLAVTNKSETRTEYMLPEKVSHIEFTDSASAIEAHTNTTQSLLTPSTANQEAINKSYTLSTGTKSEAASLAGNIVCNTTFTAPGKLLTVNMITPANEAAEQDLANKRSLLKLNYGATLFNPSKDLTVLTAFGELRIRAGAAVLTMLQDSGALSIFNLHDRNLGEVRFDASGQQICIPIGQHLTVAAGQILELSQVNAIDCIAHRNIRRESNNRMTIFSSEFSILSALSGLTQLRNSKAPAHRVLMMKCLKNAASIFQMSNNKQGPYRQVTKTEMYMAMH